MADTIAVILTFVITLVLTIHSNGCNNSEPLSISTEEPKSIEITLSQDDNISALSSIDTTRSLMVDRLFYDTQTIECRTITPLSTNTTNAYPEEFIDPYYDYCEYKELLAEIAEVAEVSSMLEISIEDAEVPTTNYISFDPSNSDITNITGASSDEWNIFIDKLCDERGYDTSHFLRGKGDVLSQIESDFSINPIGLISIWVWESDIGSSSIGQSKHNLAGIKSGKSYRYFDTYTECMIYHGKLLRNSYVDEGLYTWVDIGDKYCPDNNEWPVAIESTVCEYNEMLYKIMTR